jgi:hypothetical protein
MNVELDPMQDLAISPTGTTPAIHFSARTGVLEIRGESYPENAFALFEPPITWLRRFMSETDTAIRFDVEVAYMNTSSIRAMVDMLDLLEQAHLFGRDVAVRWLYDEENERALDMGEEFKEDLTLPFEIVTLSSQE